MYAITSSTFGCNKIDKFGHDFGHTPAFFSSAYAMWEGRHTIVRNYGVSPTLNSGFSFGSVSDSLPEMSTRSKTLLVNKETTKNPDFKRRMAAGEVVVSPYLIDRITVIERQTLKRNGDRYTGYVTRDDLSPITGMRIFQDLGINYSVCPYNGQYMPTDGEFWYFIDIFYEFSNSFSAVWPAPIDALAITAPFENVSVDRAFLQGVVSEAYKKAVDALTALAEAPETINGIFSVLRTAGDLIINRKKKAAELVELFKHKREVLNKAFEVKLKILTLVRSRSNRDISRNNAAITRARKALVRDLARNSKDSASAVASLWLSFRYAIMPNVYLIQDIVKATKMINKSRQNSSSQKVEALTPTSVSGFSVTGSRVRYHKAWCQVSLELNPVFGGLRSTTSFDILVTAWELVPLSFVVDWFVGVGNALSVLTPPADSKSVGVTYAMKDVSNLTYTGTNGGVTTIIRESYSRSVQTTEDFSGLHLNVQLNWKRYIDAGALLWNISLKKRLRY